MSVPMCVCMSCVCVRHTDLVKSLRGHMMELLRHPQGADVLVDLYDVASTQMRNTMVRHTRAHTQHTHTHWHSCARLFVWWHPT